MSISGLFTLRPVATTLLMVAILLAGFEAYRNGGPVRLAELATDFVDRP